MGRQLPRAIQLTYMNTLETLSPEQVIQDYQGLVFSIARSYQKSGVPLEDLQQEGMIGLLEAHRRYDPSKQTKFSTYAVFWIKKHILSAIEQEYHSSLNTVEISENHFEQIADLGPQPESAAVMDGETLILPEDIPELEARILRLSYEKQKTIKEIATLLGLSHEKVKQLRQKAIRRMKNIRKE